MIDFLCMADNVNPMRKHLKSWGWPLRRHVRIRRYEDRPAADDLSDRLVIFSDVDRMPGSLTQQAVELWQALADRPTPPRLLNRPGASMRRVELLKRLHEIGVNEFTVYHPDEPRDALRYPVFVRHAVEHLGTFTNLLHDVDELEAAIDDLVARGQLRDELLIVEYLDTSEAGVFRKYSAMKVGETIIPHHVFFQADEWHVKRQGTSLHTADVVEEERRYHDEHPHHDTLREIYDLAKIDYGRIDYAVRDGRVQVWEINPNPTVLVPLRRYRPVQLPTRRRFAAAFNRCLLELDGQDKATLDRLDGNPPLWMRLQARVQRTIKERNAL